jgi:hypothetical protein
MSNFKEILSAIFVMVKLISCQAKQNEISLLVERMTSSLETRIYEEQETLILFLEMLVISILFLEKQIF